MSKFIKLGIIGFSIGFLLAPISITFLLFCGIVGYFHDELEAIKIF